MPTTVREVMTANPLAMVTGANLTAAAQQMRNADIGDVIVVDGERVVGIVTDRDIALRAVAEQLDPKTTTLAEVATHDLVTLAPEDDVRAAAGLMRTHAVRRLPVLDGDHLVGVVSLGDLAVEQDPESVLGEISANEPNN